MRFEEFREQMRAISQGRKIRELDKARNIAQQMIEIGVAEPQWRQRAAEIFELWCKHYYPEQIPHLLQTTWEEKDAQILTQRQQQEQRAKTAVARKKELNQEIERLILIASIEQKRADPRHALTAQIEEARLAAEKMQAQALSLENGLQERITALKGKIA